MTTAFLILLVALVTTGVVLILFSWHLLLWLQAYASGTDIGFVSLLLMSLKGIKPQVVVRCKVMALQAGLAHISTKAIESLYLAGGDVHRVTLALISADRANLTLDWDTASAIDLAGRDILEAVISSVTPKTIPCPALVAGSPDTLYGVAQDGIQLKVRVLVTVRTELAKMIGGAGEPTIVARVGEGIVAAIGACSSYEQALADPALISREVTSRCLDSQTSFTIVSIDIADIDVGANIGARLRLDQADADMRVALAESEARRTMAVALQQEMVAVKRGNQADLLLNEAKIPSAIAAEFLRPRLRVVAHTATA